MGRHDKYLTRLKGQNVTLATVQMIAEALGESATTLVAEADRA